MMLVPKFQGKFGQWHPVLNHLDGRVFPQILFDEGVFGEIGLLLITDKASILPTRVEERESRSAWLL